MPSTRSKESYSEKSHEMWNNLVHREKMSQVQSELWKDPKHRDKMLASGGLWGRGNMDVHRMKLSEAQKRLWANPKHRDRIVKLAASGATIHPNRREIQMQEILNDLQLRDWWFNDNARNFVIAGKRPDFFNEGGRKVIEVFGEVYHNPEKYLRIWKKPLPWAKTESGTLMIYESVGWDCLIIWEDELDTEEACSKVMEFTGLTAKT